MVEFAIPGVLELGIWQQVQTRYFSEKEIRAAGGYWTGTAHSRKAGHHGHGLITVSARQRLARVMHGCRIAFGHGVQLPIHSACMSDSRRSQVLSAL
jgi:hypothetical protein